MPSPFHRGDYRRVRHSIVVAMIELEVLEPKMQLAYKMEQIPPEVVADLSLARLMVTEVDGLLRSALDVAIADTGKYYEVYADATYDKRRLVA
jgi:hypothetical protein